MRMGIEEIEIKEDKTVKKLIDELKLTSAILLEVNGEELTPVMVDPFWVAYFSTLEG